MIYDVGGAVHRRAAGIERSSQRAVLFTDIRVENVIAGLAQGVFTGYPRYTLGSPVEGGNPPIRIDGENALVYRIEYNMMECRSLLQAAIRGYNGRSGSGRSVAFDRDIGVNIIVTSENLHRIAARSGDASVSVRIVDRAPVFWMLLPFKSLFPEDRPGFLMDLFGNWLTKPSSLAFIFSADPPVPIPACCGVNSRYLKPRTVKCIIQICLEYIADISGDA